MARRGEALIKAPKMKNHIAFRGATNFLHQKKIFRGVLLTPPVLLIPPVLLYAPPLYVHTRVQTQVDLVTSQVFSH